MCMYTIHMQTCAHMDARRRRFIHCCCWAAADIINFIRRAKCVIVVLMSCSMSIEWSYVHNRVRTEWQQMPVLVSSSNNNISMYAIVKTIGKQKPQERKRTNTNMQRARERCVCVCAIVYCVSVWTFSFSDFTDACVMCDVHVYDVTPKPVLCVLHFAIAWIPVVLHNVTLLLSSKLHSRNTQQVCKVLGWRCNVSLHSVFVSGRPYNHFQWTTFFDLLYCLYNSNEILSNVNIHIPAIGL